MDLVKRNFIRWMGVLAAFSLAVNLLLLTMPLYMLQIYDRVLSSRSLDTLVFLSAIALFALTVLGMLEIVRSMIGARLATRMQVHLGADTLSASLQNTQGSSGDVQPLRDLNTISTLLGSKSIFAVLDIPFTPLFIGLLYFLHPTLFVLTLAGAVTLTIIAFANYKLERVPSQTSNMQSIKALKIAGSFAEFSESLAAMGMRNSSVNAWGKANALALKAQNKAAGRAAILSGISKTIRSGLQIAVLGWGAWLVIQGEMSAGMIFAASIISGRGLQPIDQVIGSWKQYLVAYKAWGRLKENLSTIGQDNSQANLDRIGGDLSVSDIVVFSPTKRVSDALLKRVGLELKSSEALAIIGPSGAGKSTLARVLVNAFSPDSGSVHLDGTNLANWSDHDRNSHIGYLSQEIQLLPGTVAQNIARMAADYDHEMVVEAAKRAHVHELIQHLPQGYETKVGYDGLILSGGQKQRIGLARAFFGKPLFIVLDEPNSNLDESGQRALLMALRQARADNITVVVVTQRRPVLAQVDKILVLKDGAVEFFGPKDKFIEIAHSRAKSRNDLEQSGNVGVKTNPNRESVTPPAIAPEVDNVIDSSFIPSFKKAPVR